MMRAAVFLMMLVSPVAALAQPGVLSEKATKNYQALYYEYDLVRMTNRVYPRISRDVVSTEISLRGDVVTAWYDEDIEERLTWVRQQDWTEEFKAMFFRAVEWRRHAFDGGAEKLYRLSRKYRHVPNAKKYGYTILSDYLLTLVGWAGHEQALKDLSKNPKADYIMDRHRGHNYLDAVKGQPYGMFGLAYSYMSGPIFDDDRTKGYYWHLRRSKLEPDHRPIKGYRDVLSRVSPAERKQAESWLESGYVPPL